MTDRVNNPRRRTTTDEISHGSASSLGSASGNCSSRPRGPNCWCGMRTVLLTCRRGPNAGRKFWRCPYWMTPTDCGEFIWEDKAKDFEEHDNKAESEGGALTVELVEGLKKKNASYTFMALSEGKIMVIHGTLQGLKVQHQQVEQKICS